MAKKEKGEWKIERTDGYYYQCGRNSTTYVEATFWYHTGTLERKETSRQESIYDGQEYKLPLWAKSITTRRRSLESSRVY
ncbi:hypothetical protein EZS27_004486 [termite gut metagenome]|uniref:Uncharacterized protein n=1 Tax=termite gut metagenome TaxID=433724 RepID=A0A5J4SPA6_9ZZZZ